MKLVNLLENLDIDGRDCILQVLQRYYIQYLCGYDAIALNQLIQSLQNLPEDESVILSSMCNEIGNLSVKQGKSFSGIRRK